MATQASPLAATRNRRIVLVVTLAALAAAAAVVGATVLQTRGERTTAPGSVTKPRPGRPPLQLELGLADTPQARALGRAETLYNRDGQVDRAAAIFRRYHSLEAQLGLAFTSWHGPSSLPTVKKIAAAHPNEPAALLNLGWAEYQSGRNADAVAAWQKAAAMYPDSPYGVDAEDALHPTEFPGLPYVVLDFQPSRAIRKLPAAKALAALARAAAGADVHAKLLYGSALWNVKRPLSAERQFEAAAKLAPTDPLARTAAAVGAFTKANPVRAFGRLGPLTGLFPRSAVVRFHLGLLLLWTGERQKAATQLRLAAADGPHTIYARDSEVLLSQLGKNGP